MPDFERLTDSLRIYVAQDSATQEFARGFQAGKKMARIEVAVVAAAAALTFALLRLVESA